MNKKKILFIGCFIAGAISSAALILCRKKRTGESAETDCDCYNDWDESCCEYSEDSEFDYNESSDISEGESADE